MSEESYVRLREFLDTLPAGYPQTPSGVEMKILRKLFSPEEAELCVNLKHDPEEVSVIADRIGADEKELAVKLENMARKGLIFRLRKDGRTFYNAVQFVVGFYEFQLNTLDKEFCELFEEYLPFIGLSLRTVKTRQLRVVPIDAAISTAPRVETYNKVKELVEERVKENSLITVMPCICRKQQGLLGKECERPKETCIVFGDAAHYTLDNGMSREISMEEAFKILELAEEEGLVLQPSNTQKLENICCCCSCCCPGLRFSKMMPRPADMVQSNYYAKIDPDLCSACGQCSDRCQMDAISEGDDSSEIRDGRCIGCGLCVPACPEEAISLIAKPDMEPPPIDFRDTLKRIESERLARA